MRANHAKRGLRVVVTGGKAKGSVGIVTHESPLGREYVPQLRKATVTLDTGERVLVAPRWLEPLEAA